MIHESFAKGLSRDMELYLCARDENLQPGVVYGPVIRDIFIVECCTGGFGTVEINGTVFPVRNGDCTVLFPGSVIVHRADNTEPRRGVFCALDGLQVASYMKNAGISVTQPYAPREAFCNICRIIEEMLADRDSADSGAHLRRSGYVYALLGEIARYSPKNTRQYSLSAEHIMEARYNTIVSVDEIADEVGLERAYFSTVFKAQTGKTPYSYLNELRIKKACALLTETDFTVSEIACAVGIAPENFSRLFKRLTGLTPMQYASKAAENQ